MQSGLVKEWIRNQESTARKVVLPLTAIYPVWHLLAPSDARDPWLIWWLISAYFVAVSVSCRYSSFVERHLLDAFNLGSALVTLHLFILASANDMHLYYAIASTSVVLSSMPTFVSARNFHAYAAFTVSLAALLYGLDPDTSKLAYWGGVLPVLALYGHRLAVLQTEERVAQDYRSRLEDHVAERTRALRQTNERLREEMDQRHHLEGELRFSQKLEATGRLAGGVAHEFNNMLTTIAIYADLLLKGLPEDSPLRADAQQVKKTVGQASNLTKQLLAFSRKQDVEAQSLDLDLVIQETREVLAHLIGADIQLVVRTDGTPHFIHAHRDELEQVLVNLALNARDAMPHGGKLEIEVGTDKAPGQSEGSPDLVLLSVSDTGAGMDEETRERAFDPFFTRKPVNQGTGLGLSLVYGVVTRAGGQVQLSSEPGSGTRVELYWPAAREASGQRGERDGELAPTGGTERILVVEDDEELRLSMERVLLGQGYHVVGTAGAEAALTEARRREFDLVVSDVVMPQMSGLELIEKMATIQPVPVLLVSGNLDHPSLRDHAIPPGVALLPKPFSMEQLAGEVRGALEASRPRAAAAPAAVRPH